MAVDSIMARPTNNVRVIVEDASGCCASEVKAVATARPSASAGPIVPKPVVRPAITIEATAIIVRLSMACPSYGSARVSSRERSFGLASGNASRCGDVHRGQDAEDIGLH